jgi:DNA polymerase I-like protein with 3'-5' exonuclease and polymerase domains
LIESKNYSQEAIDLEHAVAQIIFRQEENGFHIDLEKAGKLYAHLKGIQERLTAELRQVFRPWYKPEKEFTPKRDNRTMGYRAGCPMTKVKLVEFNPSSGQHIADRLIKEFGWKPKEFTETGAPKVDETVLKKLPYPVVRNLIEYLTVNKRIGQLAEGDEAWLKHQKDGVIHGGVNTNGAVTGRMTHMKPNMAQVPSVDHPYGHECRELFGARPGWALVGADASGLELRCLGHYMARYDDGEYGRLCIDPNVKIHAYNRALLELPEDPPGTNVYYQIAKRWMYAFLYGAGDAKLGEIFGSGGAQKGKHLRSTFMANLPALNSLVSGVKAAAEKRGYLVGLDGRRLHIRSLHSALNTLLQGAGAIIMKKALVILDADLQAMFKPGVDYEFCANVHDEWQIECRPEIAEVVGKTAVEAIRKAGEHFKFRIPLDGEFKIGKTWADTH